MKKFIKTTSGKKGGLFVGKSHDKGGIPAIVVDTGQPIEVEGGEVIINKEASKKYWKELSKINQSAGNGVPIPPPMDFSADVEKYKGGGKITMSSLKQGTEIEMEHAKTIAEFKKQSVSLKEVARKIAKDHLKENPNYYKIISKLKLKNGGEIVCRSCGWSWLKSEGGDDLYICHKCNADNQKFYKNGGQTQSLSLPEKSKIYEQWKDLVNMSKPELNKFYNSVEGKEAGLTDSEARELGIDNGRTSARWIMKMKDVPFVNWTDEMWRWAKKQINFIKRMSGNRGALYNDKGVKTRKHTSLLIWGHNPEKFNLGGSLSVWEKNGFREYPKTSPQEWRLVEWSINGHSPSFKGKLYFQSGTGLMYIEKANGEIYKPKSSNKIYWREINEYAEGGLIAPNGKPSNLTPEQYKLVRMPEFKAWFGDWEKSPQTSSKVVDENGEPLVVYHSSKRKFNIFEKEKISENFEYSFGFHFSNNIEDSKKYGKITKSFFLKITNPFVFNVKDKSNGSVFIDINRYDAIHEIVKSRKTEKEIDGVIAYSSTNGYVTMYSNQIKLADGSNTTFDENNPDIRFAKGGRTKKANSGGNKIKAENKGGDCYIVAGKIALNKKLPIFAKEKEFPKFNGTPYVVHAEVSGQGSISGLRYGHAWVEDDLYVYDFSNGREIVFPKHIYYVIGNVVEETPKYFKYTFKEAIEKMLETGHYGSWELKTESNL